MTTMSCSNSSIYKRLFSTEYRERGSHAQLSKTHENSKDEARGISKYSYNRKRVERIPEERNVGTKS